jgi:hypothetical protein
MKHGIFVAPPFCKGEFMKQLIAVLLLIFIANAASAEIDKDARPQVYTFKFKLKGETLEIRRPASTYEEAYEKAASSCFDHFRKAYGGRVSEDTGLDIIDVCANPRS